MGFGAADIARLDGEIAARLPSVSDEKPVDHDRSHPEQARFRLFDAVAKFLTNAGHGKPLLLVLDDLHWADEPSLRLLCYLADEVPRHRLMVLGTYRDVSLDGSHPLARTLGELASKNLESIRLSGLSRTDVGEFIASILGTDAPSWLTAIVWKNTEGNPFFVCEVVRLLVAEGRWHQIDLSDESAASSVEIPQAVREVNERRFQRLSPDCHQLLRLAAVVGRLVGLDVLRRLSELPEERLLDVLDEAVSARLLEELPGSGIRYGFTHALIRETLYEGHGKARRVSLHGRIGRVLEELHKDNPGPQLAELAHHFYQAAPGGDVNRALEYSQKAAQRSMDVLAYEEAVRYFRMALEAWQFQSSPDDPRRYELLVSLGEAQSAAGQHSAAIETFTQAVDAARLLGLPEQLARATYDLSYVSLNCGRPAAPVIEPLEQALRALGTSENSWRVRILSELCRASSREGRINDAAKYDQLAIEMLRKVHDARAPHALYVHIERLLAMQRFDEARQCAIEMLSVADEIGDTYWDMVAHMWSMVLALCIGDKPGFEMEFETHVKLAERLQRPLHLYFAAGQRAMRATLEGRFQDAEQLALHAASLGKRVGAESADGTCGLQMFTIRREQGRLREIAPAIQRLTQIETPTPLWRPGLAVIYAEVGLAEQARTELNRLAVDNFAAVPRDALWPVCISYLADVCALVHDARHGEMLYRALLPMATRNVVAGDAVVCYGAASRFLGQLATILSRWDEAESHFQHAMTMNESIGGTPWLAHTKFQYASMLRARGRCGDQKQAEVLLDEARQTAEQLGMRSLLNQITDDKGVKD
jgi:tetratricopeptide (TPR) repeat protein